MTTPTLGSLSAAFDALRRKYALAIVAVNNTEGYQQGDKRYEAEMLARRLSAARRAMNAGNVMQALSYLEGE